jgi:hypothetical protein
MKRRYRLKTSAVLAIVCGFLSASATGAAAGDWAVASGGCKVWNPHPVPGETARWTGSCKDGLVEGPGVLEWQRGDKTYERDEGIWRSGRQTGEGSQTWPRGQYNGQFADSLPTGSGALTLGDSRYGGSFLNGKPNGRGVLKNASGVYDGSWQDGCFNEGNRRASFGVPLDACP